MVGDLCTSMSFGYSDSTSENPLYSGIRILVALFASQDFRPQMWKTSDGT